MVKTLENSFEDFMNFIDSLSSESVIKDLEELGVVFGECNETETYAVDSVSVQGATRLKPRNFSDF